MSQLDDTLHIIISGERGKVLRIPCSKKKLRIWSILICSLVLGGSITLFGTLFTSLEEKKLLAETKDNANVQLQQASTLQLRQLEELEEQVEVLQKQNREQLEQFQQEKELLLGETMEELSSRSQLMEKLFQSIGIIVPKKTKILLQKSENSGGPFRELSPGEGQKEEIINRIDSYLAKAKSIPLGRPSTGRITSPFGKRRDPLNGRISFHDGIDIKGWKGEKIHATAGGVVTRAGRLGGYGKYLEIRHGNGYETAYAHMSEILVKKGQKINRGDVVGLIGSTGRSTGPHLHYEIRRNNRRVNPGRFINIASALKNAQR